MRNDNKPWKRQGYKSGGRTGKQFGGPLAQPGVAQPGVAQPLAQPGVAPVRPLGFKGGKRVKGVHGGVLARPVARPLGFKKGSKSSNVYNKKK